MAMSKCLQQIWDHCIELEAMIWSHTVLDSFELQGQVPETIVSGQTADISLFIEYAWFDWIIYYDQVVSFPDLKEQLGWWLGPAIDLGPAMTAKILKANGQVEYNSTHCSLTDAELDDPIQIAVRDAFMTQLNAVIGLPVEQDKLALIHANVPTPEHELYEDNNESVVGAVLEIDVVMPEMQDGYIGAEVNLPHQGLYRSDTVQKRARNAEGALEGTANPNPTLDSRTYQVEFDDRELASFSASLIVEHMYQQCDFDGNQYRMMDELIDHQTDDTAVSFAD
jgi:hypothetical protein